MSTEPVKLKHWMDASSLPPGTPWVWESEPIDFSTPKRCTGQHFDTIIHDDIVANGTKADNATLLAAIKAIASVPSFTTMMKGPLSATEAGLLNEAGVFVPVRDLIRHVPHLGPLECPCGWCINYRDSLGPTCDDVLTDKIARYRAERAFDTAWFTDPPPPKKTGRWMTTPGPAGRIGW